MALTASEKTRIKYFLGYQGINQRTAMLTGIPYLVQTVVTIDGNLEQLTDEHAEEIARRLLGRLEETEEQIFCAQTRLKIRAAADVEFNNNEIRQLIDAYKMWGSRLADLLGVYFYTAGYLRSLGYSDQPGSVPRVHG